MMLAKIAFIAAILLPAVIAELSYNNKDKFNINLKKLNFTMLQRQPSAVQACCPEIDDEHSFIKAYPDYLARVALLVNWGNCTASSHPFVCCVEWGDGDAVCSEYDNNIGYCQLTHGYPKGTFAEFLVTAYYCNYLDEYNSCCDIYYKHITVDH